MPESNADDYVCTSPKLTWHGLGNPINHKLQLGAIITGDDTQGYEKRESQDNSKLIEFNLHL